MKEGGRRKVDEENEDEGKRTKEGRRRKEEE